MINKTYFTGKTTFANRMEVFSWLNANAAEYFDEIVLTAESEEKILCKIGEITALELNFASSGYLYSITLKNGSCNHSDAAWSSDNAIRKAVKTSGGIWLYTNDVKNIFISHNTDGGVVMAALMDISSSRRSVWTGDFENSLSWECCDTLHSDLTEDYCSGMGIRKKKRTAVVELCFNDTDEYSDTLFFVPYTQYIAQSDIIIDIDGTKYFYNGIFALKE